MIPYSYIFPKFYLLSTDHYNLRMHPKAIMYKAYNYRKMRRGNYDKKEIQIFVIDTRCGSMIGFITSRLAASTQQISDL